MVPFRGSPFSRPGPAPVWPGPVGVHPVQYGGLPQGPAQQIPGNQLATATAPARTFSQIGSPGIRSFGRTPATL